LSKPPPEGISTPVILFDTEHIFDVIVIHLLVLVQVSWGSLRPRNLPSTTSPPSAFLRHRAASHCASAPPQPAGSWPPSMRLRSLRVIPQPASDVKIK
jgi:hypothetical protein